VQISNGRATVSGNKVFLPLVNLGKVRKVSSHKSGDLPITATKNLRERG